MNSSMLPNNYSNIAIGLIFHRLVDISQSIIPKLSVLGAWQYTPQEHPLNVLELYTQSHLGYGIN